MATKQQKEAYPIRQTIALLLALSGAFVAWQVIPYQLDDAYITYRYANYLSSGAGPVFNLGGPWVEGFTSPAWCLLLAGVSAGLGPAWLPRAGVALGLLSFSLVGFLAWRIGSSTAIFDEGPADWSPVVCVLLISLLPGVTYYAVTGLEPLLFLAVVLLYSGASAGRIHPITGIAAGVISTWIRPEGAWFPIMLIVQTLAQHGLRFERSRRFYILFASPILGGISISLIRFQVFGELLPNTYFAKSPSWAHGFGYVVEHLGSSGGSLLLLLGLLGAAFGSKESRGYFAAGLSWVVAVLLEGGDWMPAGRMLLPGYALFALSGAGIARQDCIGIRWSRQKGLAPVYVLLIAALLFVITIVSVTTGRKQAAVAAQSMGTIREEAARITHWVLVSDASSIGLVDIGQLGHETDLEIFDIAGLTDATIAHSAGGLLEKEFDLAYLFETRAPDLLLMRFRCPPQMGEDGSRVVNASECAATPVEARILQDSSLHENYRLRHIFLPGYKRSSYYGRLLYTRLGFSPDSEAMAIWPARDPNRPVTIIFNQSASIH